MVSQNFWGVLNARPSPINVDTQVLSVHCEHLGASMSRGEGRLQRALISLFLEKAPNTLTWEDIKADVCERAKLDKAMFSIVHGSLERSLRRALQSLSGPITDRLPSIIVTIPRDGRSRFSAFFPPFHWIDMPRKEARKKCPSSGFLRLAG